MKLIRIRTFDTYIQAHMAMGLLENAGIKGFLQDENTVTIDPILTNAVGGIKLLVLESEKEAAEAVLNEVASENKVKCPYCGSENVEYIITGKPKNWFWAIVSFSLSNYAVGVDKEYHCFDCKKNFQEFIKETEE